MSMSPETTSSTATPSKVSLNVTATDIGTWVASFFESLAGGLMSNRNVSKMMTVAMIIVGALGLTGNSVANDVLTAVGGLGYTAHVINPTKTAS